VGKGYDPPLMKRAVLAVLLLALPSWAQTLHFAKDRPIDAIHLRLEGAIDLESQTFVGTARLDCKALRTIRTVRLDAVDLKVEKILLQSAEPGEPKPLEFANTGKELQIRLPREFERGVAFSLVISYSVHKPAKGLYFFKPSKAQPKVPYQAWTQGETLEARHWIPITDQPNERLTSELIISCDPQYEVLSNGKLVANVKTEQAKTVHWLQDKEHVPYLITLVVGEFAILREKWRGKELSYWVPPHRKGDAMRSFGNTRRMMDFFSDRIGVEYPWDKYAQVVVEQFGWGGMENTSATTLNERTLHGQRAHLDYSSDGLVAHELAHQWFGDLLTCKDWAHTWLNEGFATYFEALWSEQDHGDDHFRHNMLGKARGAINGGKDKPIVWQRYNGPWEQFDGRAYPKGAWVLHMIRRQLGEEDWWRSVHHYVTKHRGQSVETKDLRIAIEEATGRSFERFFYDWTARPGSPVVEVTHKWDPKRNMMEVRIRQKQKGEAFHFPLDLEYHVRETRLGFTQDVDSKDSRFMVPLPARPHLVRVDPRFAVLMELKESKAKDWWQAQLQRDPDAIARIRAARHFGGIKKSNERRLLAQALKTEQFWGAQAEIATALGRSGGSRSRDALLAALTNENPKARKAVVEALGKFRGDAKVRDALAAIVAKGDPSYQVEAAAIAAWARTRPENAIEVLIPLLDRESHRDSIRESVLRAIGDQGGDASLELLISWTRRGKPRGSRTAAMQGLGSLVKNGKLSSEQVARVIKATTACLHRLEHRGVKTQAAQLLRDLGGDGTAALPALEALRDHDPNSRVREEAGKAIERIESGAPTIVQVDRLRKALQAAREADRKLRERLEQLEQKHPTPVK